jgi:hypothetical protein
MNFFYFTDLAKYCLHPLITMRCDLRISASSAEITILTMEFENNTVSNTKCVYIKSTTVYVPSSELGLSQPLSRHRVSPYPRTGGGGLTSLACG